MSTESKKNYLAKRSEFRTKIKDLAKAQREDKDTFRNVKRTQPCTEARDAVLRSKRFGIVDTKSTIRHLLLAYAMFRFRSYAKVEQKCTDKPNAYLIYDAFKKLGLGGVVDKDLIDHWLAGGALLPKLELPELPELPVVEGVKIQTVPLAKVVGW